MRTRVADLATALVANRPTARLASGRARLGSLVERLGTAFAVQQRTGSARLDSLEHRLRAVGPDSVLSRGFTYTLDAQGKLVRSVRSVSAGDLTTTVLADGRVHARVEEIQEGASGESSG